jgi:hypothetical protein
MPFTVSENVPIFGENRNRTKKKLWKILKRNIIQKSSVVEPKLFDLAPALGFHKVLAQAPAPAPALSDYS